MASATVLSPDVSLSLEKVTYSTPLDALYLISLRHYRDWVYLDPETHIFEWRQVQRLMLTTHNKETFQLSAECPPSDRNMLWPFDDIDSPGCNYEFKVTPVDRIDSDWSSEVAMGFIDAEGNLKKLGDSRDFQATGEFIYEKSDLDRVTDAGDLTIFLWISRIPLQLSDVLFGQQFCCSKAQFLALQTAVKRELYRANPIEQWKWSNPVEQIGEAQAGWRLYTANYGMNLKSFKSIFDSPWLPTNFNYGDFTIGGESRLLSLSSVLIHNYTDWIGSKSTFHQVLRPKDQPEWLLTVTPGVDTHDVSLAQLSSLDAGGDPFLFRFYMSQRDQPALQYVGFLSPDGAAKNFALQRSICDQLVDNNCWGFFVQILIDDADDIRLSLISTEGTLLTFTSAMLAGSEMIQNMLRDTDRSDPNDEIKLPTIFNEETLVQLHFCLLFGCDHMDEVYSDQHQLLEKMYEVADFLLHSQLQDKIESHLGYRPQIKLARQA